MTAALGPRVMRHPDMRGNMEQFVLQFVTPEFASLNAYMHAIVRILCLFFFPSSALSFLASVPFPPLPFLPYPFLTFPPLYLLAPLCIAHTMYCI
jgi:hypothetical protein